MRQWTFNISNAPQCCKLLEDRLVMSEAAVEFLRKHGDRSVVSLGCGNSLNRLDNHIRLMVKCGLEYYVAIDRVTDIRFNKNDVFTDQQTVHSILSSYYNGRTEEIFDKIRTFPDTYVEELEGISCQVVVCQRILPFRHWENIIKSMNPVLILQEDLRGCELQEISGPSYKRTFPGILHYQLQPFRPNRLIPGEKNIILWRRRDFFPCHIDSKSWWHRFLFRISNSAKATIHG